MREALDSSSYSTAHRVRHCLLARGERKDSAPLPVVTAIAIFTFWLLYLIYCALPPYKCVMECSGTPCIHDGSVQPSTELKLIYRQATVVANRRKTLLGYRYGDRQNICGDQTRTRFGIRIPAVGRLERPGCRELHKWPRYEAVDRALSKTWWRRFSIMLVSKPRSSLRRVPNIKL